MSIVSENIFKDVSLVLSNIEATVVIEALEFKAAFLISSSSDNSYPYKQKQRFLNEGLYFKNLAKNIRRVRDGA